MYIVAWKKKTKETKEHYEVENVEEFIDHISFIMKHEFVSKQPNCSIEDIIWSQSDWMFIPEDVRFIGISKKDEEYLFLDYRYFKEVNEKEFYESML